MAGLESIALAVAHLERVQEQEKQSSSGYYTTEAAPTLESSPPLPSVSFGGSPRMVSADYSIGVSMAPQLLSESANGATKTLNLAVVGANPVGATKRSRDAAAMPAEVDALLHQISNASEDLEQFNRLMEELQKIGLAGKTQPQPIPNPDEEISTIASHDVLLGRGGETNHHPGNIRYRQLVKACQAAYLAAKRRDKPRIAVAIVKVVRSRNGRFLKKHESIWKDVGNTRAREKTSQALREGAPTLRGNSKKVQLQQAPTMLPQPVAIMGSHGGVAYYHHPTAAEQHHAMTSIGAPVYHASNGYPTFANQVTAVTGDPSPKTRPKKKRKLVASPSQTQRQYNSLPATTVVATVSAEEHSEGEPPSSSSYKSIPPKKQSRGPRIKQLLKKRMIQDSTTSNSDV